MNVLRFFFFGFFVGTGGSDFHAFKKINDEIETKKKISYKLSIRYDLLLESVYYYTW